MPLPNRNSNRRKFNLRKRVRPGKYPKIKPATLAIAGLLVISIYWIFAVANALLNATSRNQDVSNSSHLNCNQDKWIDITSQGIQESGIVSNRESHCFFFQLNNNAVLDINTNNGKARVNKPDGNNIIFQGSGLQNLTQSGKYKIVILGQGQISNYELKLSFKTEHPADHSSNYTVSMPNPGSRSSNSSLSGNTESSSSSNLQSLYPSEQLSYNVKQKPPFYPDPQIQAIVDEVVNVAVRRGLSAQTLSISLIDLSQSSCCAYGSYQDRKARFPASIAKLFWIVAYYSQVQAGAIDPNQISQSALHKMINKSDNEPASDVVDAITKTRSQGVLPKLEFQDWLSRRKWINRFFQKAGYQNINISQKNFPIPKLNFSEPQGVDLQMRDGSDRTIRNYVRPYDVARLLYEIETGQAISSSYSQKIKARMKRNLNPGYWQNIQYNSVEGFFPEFLPVGASVFSKVGWYSGSRQDAAIIYSPDRQVRYILVIFGEDKIYAQDWEIFPELSSLIYQRMLAIK